MPAPTLIIDFDSTFVAVESLDELARIALADLPDRAAINRRLQAITEQGMNGTIGFGESLAKRFAMFKTNRQHIGRLIDLLRGNITASVERNRQFFRTHAGSIYIISGGFSEYIIPVAADYGIDAAHVLANRFVFAADGSVTGYDTGCPLAHDNGKTTQISNMNLRRPIYIIGDGYGDYQVKAHGQADKFLAFTENVRRPAVIAKADAVLAGFDKLPALIASL